MQVSDDEASRESVIPTVFHSAEEQPGTVRRFPVRIERPKGDRTGTAAAIEKLPRTPPPSFTKSGIDHTLLEKGGSRWQTPRYHS